MDYKLGVIGGMGPKATSVFMDKLIEHTDAEHDQEHINMLILNHATLPDRTKVILQEQEHIFLEAVSKDIQLLEGAGVEHIAIPCNTAHYFYEQVQEMTRINVINMVEETVKELYQLYGPESKVGILATKGTLKSGIYERSCAKYNLQPYIPAEGLQEEMMEIIYHNVKAGLHLDSSRLERLIKELIHQEKCKGVIIACTELSCLPLSEEVSPYVVDAMQVLVERAILLSGKKVKQPRTRQDYYTA